MTLSSGSVALVLGFSLIIRDKNLINSQRSTYLNIHVR